MPGELLNILQPSRVALIPFKKLIIRFLEYLKTTQQCNIDNFKKCYDVNSLFPFWKSFFSKQQANIYYYISVSLIKSLFLDRLRNDIHQN